MSDPRNLIDKIRRINEMLDECSLATTILLYARRGRATPLMIEQAIAIVEKHIDFAKEDNDQGQIANALTLKAGLEQALVDGVKTLRVVQGPGDESLKVETPIAEARIAAGHMIRRQRRCAGGVIDIYDVTTDELIECKLRGTSAALGEAAGQLQRYRKSFPGASLTIAVLCIEAEAQWMAEVLIAQGINIVEIEGRK